MTGIDPTLLPVGHHYDLHIEQTLLSNAGAFTGGGWKIVWHTTESNEDSVDAIRSLFVEREKAGVPSHSHLLVGAGIGRKKHPSVVQFVPFNRASKALQHPSGTPETNRANCIQIVICGWAAESGDWSDSRYKALANLVALINHRRPVASHISRAFDNDRRFTSGGFVVTRGHVGHKHVPSNDHTDPGDGFKARLLLELLGDAPHQL